MLKTLIQAGSIIEARDKDRVICGVVLVPGDKQLRALLADGRDLKIQSAKILHSNSGLDVSKGKDFLVSALRAIQEKRENLKEEIQLNVLWETVGETEEVRTPEDLASLWFGPECGPDHVAAMLRILHKDWGYFRPRGDGFFPVDRKAVQIMEEGRRSQAEHKEKEETFVSWLASGGTGPLLNGSAHFLEIVLDYLVNGEQSVRLKQAQDLLKRGKIPDQDALFRILVGAGVLKENENLLLKKFKVPSVFPERVEQEAAEAIAGWKPAPSRLDLTGIPTVTIDDEATTDIDDALSVEDLGTAGKRIGIHIADVSELVPKDSALDREAHARSTSIYLPDQKITMLPGSITEAASLKQGEVRPALSVLATFRSGGQLASWEIRETLIRVKRRLTYDQADAMAEEDGCLSRLYQTALQFQEDRRRTGAMIVQFPKIEVAVENGEIAIKEPEPRSKSQILVSEWMIFANRLAAQFALQHQIPVLYRTQAPAGKVFELSDGDWVTLFRQRRCMRKGEVTTQPAPHHGLGLQAYLQMSSPIRRYADLVIHRQLKAHLNDRPLAYSEEELEAIRAYSDRWVEISDLVEREWRRYWLLKYLERKIGARFEAVVLESNLNEYLLFIPELALEVSCARGAKGYSEGDRLQVSLELVKPREGLIKVIPV